MRGRLVGPGVALLSSLLCVALLELGTRVVFALREDPALLLYGTPWDEARASARWNTWEGQARWDRTVRVDERPIKIYVEGPYGAYSKYQPGSMRGMKLASGAPYRIVHNNRGFRGPDFTRDKPPGVLRVAALGASSTFGYLDRDDETYPHYLESELSRRAASEGCGDVERIEVLNLGIPHLNSANLYALFMSEALAFDPDVVTFYEGANESRRIERGRGERAVLDLSRFSLALRWISHLIEDRLETFSAEDVEHHLRGKREEFLRNLTRIADECERRGVPLVVSTQQARSYAVPNERMNDVGYWEEVALVRSQLAAGERLDLARLQFLIHADVTEGLRHWATRRRARLVDFIAALEAAGERDALLSWVHLAPEANRVLARLLADEVFAAVCRGEGVAEAGR